MRIQKTARNNMPIKQVTRKPLTGTQQETRKRKGKKVKMTKEKETLMNLRKNRKMLKIPTRKEREIEGKVAPDRSLKEIEKGMQAKKAKIDREVSADQKAKRAEAAARKLRGKDQTAKEEREPQTERVLNQRKRVLGQSKTRNIERSRY